MQVRLRIESEEARRRSESSQAWIRAGQTLRVGSSYTDFVVRGDPELAAQHFEITCEGGRAWIVNLAGEDLTLLNGKPVEKGALQHGDQIRAGSTVFSVEVRGAAETDSQSAPEEPSAQPSPAEPKVAKLKAPKPRFKILNQTPFKVAFLPGRVQYPAHTLTLIVKGTFELKAGDRATPVKKQPGCCGDIPFEDDAQKQSAPRYSSDMVFFKPRADLLLAGHCRPPGGQPVRQCPVTFQVGQQSRRLLVFGKRYWQGMLAVEPSMPRMFETLPLRYEHAYGGEGERRNPVGKGALKVEDTAGKLKIPVPEIEDATAPMQRPSAKPEPGGFGPLKWNWLPRHPLLGTYDQRWLKTRWPWFPEDLDWRHFNAAPPAMQVDDYLHGDESLYLQNLLPDAPEFRGQLAGLRVRSFLHDAGDGFQEVPMQLDTLWVDADKAQVVLVWRGVARVNSHDFREIKHWYLIAEPVDEPVPNPREGFDKLLDARKPKPKPAPPPKSNQEQLAQIEAELKLAQADLAVAMADLRQELAAAGVDPDNLGQLNPEAKAHFEQVFGVSLDDEPEPPPQPWTRERVVEHVAAEGTFAGETLQGLDLSGLDLSKANFSNAQFTSVKFADATLTEARFKGCTLFEADFSGAILERAVLTDAKAPQARFTGANLSGAALIEATVTGADFQQAVLTKAKLGKARASGANFAKAQLQEALFGEAKLEKCNFAQADLTKADLSKALLNEVTFDGANLSQAKLEKAQLTSARLVQANATKAELIGANLTRATLDGTDLTKANLMSANLTRASCRQVCLVGANLQKIDGNQCDFTESDLSGVRAADSSLPLAKLIRCVANKSIWSRAQLDGADFTWADARGGEFSSSSCAGACFKAADLKQARFRKANLAGANLRDANLFEASLAKADLTKADVSGANLFAAGLMEANLKDLIRDGQTNVKQTLLTTLYA